MGTPQIIMALILLLGVCNQFYDIYKSDVSSDSATGLFFVVIGSNAAICYLLHWGGFW